MSAFLKSRTGVVLLAFLAIAAFFLITEHAAHVLGVLPFVLVLLCPLMHLFMRHGHSSGGSESTTGDQGERSEEDRL
jgi:hypothetical protein